MYPPEYRRGECCDDLVCVITFVPLVTACQLPCETDADCQRKFLHKALVCRQDAAVCPVIRGGKCCVPG